MSHPPINRTCEQVTWKEKLLLRGEIEAKIEEQEKIVELEEYVERLLNESTK